MEISIEKLKTLGTKIISDINHEKEPLEQLRNCLDILDKVISGEASFPDEKTSNYYYESFLCEIAKIALKSKHYENEEVILKNIVDD